MSFTVDDFQDLLRLIDQHPEWRDELRRRLLTDELLGLPALVREIAEGQLASNTRLDTLTDRLDTLTARVDTLTDRLDTLTARVDTLTDRLDTLTARVDTLTARVDELAQAQLASNARLDELAQAQLASNARLDELVQAQLTSNARLDALEDTQRSILLQLQLLSNRVGSLEGWELESRFAQRAPSYFSPLARRIQVISVNRLADLLDEAVDRDLLTEAERNDIMLADLVFTGRRRSDGELAYFVTEVSVGVGVDDVRRAADRAARLSKLGQPGVPVVAGHSILPDAAAYARESGVAQVLDGRMEAA
jgi:uncharacterized protein YoxC